MKKQAGDDFIRLNFLHTSVPSIFCGHVFCLKFIFRACVRTICSEEDPLFIRKNGERLWVTEANKFVCLLVSRFIFRRNKYYDRKVIPSVCRHFSVIRQFRENMFTFFELQKIPLNTQNAVFKTMPKIFHQMFFLFSPMKCKKESWFNIFTTYFKTCKKKSHSVGSFFFFTVYLCQIFLFKNDLSSEVRTKLFQAVAPGSNLCRAIFLRLHWHLLQLAVDPISEWLGKEGSEALSTVSNPSISTFFLFC